MGIDWIDDILQQAESRVHDWPILGGIVHDLRFAWEVWRRDPIDAHSIRAQHTALTDLHGTAQSLLSEFNESLIDLRQHWQSDPTGVAYQYLGPEISAFQVEHDMEPVNKGDGWHMWQNLAAVVDLLDFNASAHQHAAEKVDQLRSLHDTLDFNIKLAAGDLGAMMATAFIPGVDVVAEPVEGAGEVYEAGQAAEAAQAVAEAERIIQGAAVVARTQRILRTVMLVGAIVAGASIIGIVLARFVFSSHGVGDGSPDIVYPPGITTEQEKQRYRELLADPALGGDTSLAAELAREGFTPAQADELIARFGKTTLATIASTPGYGGNTLQYLYTLRFVLGIDKVVKDLVTSGENALGAQGTLFELEWMAAHVDELAAVQLPATGSDGLPKKGPDARLLDGTLIQLKNYDWNLYNPFVRRMEAEKLLAQIHNTREERNYPGVPIVYVFNSRTGRVPQDVLDILTKSKEWHDVTIVYWP